ncbi:hypothetical protein Droror1_Dr00005579 [Drosera rotundifolia]
MAPGAALCVMFILYSVFASGSSTDRKWQEAVDEYTNKEMDFADEDYPTLVSSSHTPTLRYIPTINPTITGTPTITPTTPVTTDPTPAAATTVPTIAAAASSGGAWCIASPSASQTALQVALDYACGYGGADCTAIQPGGSCYNPNTIRDHASYAFNDYYQKNPVSTSCVFGGVAQLNYTDPSSGTCHYTPPTTSTSSPATPTIQSPPSPIISTIPTGGATVYGEPTGSPNMAAYMERNILLVSCTTIMLMYVHIAKYI